MTINLDAIDWEKGNGLVPAIVQHAVDGRVLMLGYMNRSAASKTIEGGRVTFFSRSKNRLWTKGETSGNHLSLVALDVDCDGDAILVLADPAGPVCHKGTVTCFSRGDLPGDLFLSQLAERIELRRDADPKSSYTSRLLKEELHRVAQKVGEEALETALAAVSRDDDAVLDESADLIYHLLVLLAKRGLTWSAVVDRLRQRHESSSVPKAGLEPARD